MREIKKICTFEASHRLWDDKLSEDKNYKVFGKCANGPSHGHSYKVELILKGNKLTHGMLRNFRDVKKVFNEDIFERFDHHFLNDVMDGLTTAENISKYIYERMKEVFPEMYKVVVWETATSSGSYYEVYEK